MYIYWIFGYLFSGILIADKITCPINNCFTCLKKETKCLDCEDGYYKSLDKCHKCPIGCSNCMNRNICSHCREFTFWDDKLNYCSSCPIFCESCQTKVKCEICIEKYYKIEENIKCIACPEYCSDCTSPENCIACFSGYFLTRKLHKSFCNKCTSNCLLCLDRVSCITCKSDYFWDKSDQVCQSCGSNCLKCDETVGCTKCGKGYIVTNSVCHQCPILHKSLCEKIMDKTRGRIWRSTSQSCIYCPENCLRCILEESEIFCIYTENNIIYSGCRSGLVWTWNYLCEMCSGISRQLLPTKEFCHQCDGYYYDENECMQCTSSTNVILSPITCERCIGGSGNYHLRGYHIVGKCLNVECYKATPTQCQVCNGYWFNAGICKETSCQQTASTILSRPECNGCENRIWIIGSCVLGTMCGGPWNNNLSIYCSHSWVYPECIALDCNNLISLDTELKCTACHNRKFEVGKGCLVIDCMRHLLNSQEACYGCRKLGLYWNNNDCTVVDCTVITINSNKYMCNACEGYYYNGINCVGNGPSSCDGVSAINESLCNQCWMLTETGNGDQCETADNNQCQKCKHKYIDDSNNCIVFERNLTISSKSICDQLLQSYWDGINCTELASDACTKADYHTFLTSMEECSACLNTYWDNTINGFCKPLDCTNIPNINTEKVNCLRCGNLRKNRYWNSEICQNINCENLDLLNHDECNTCSESFYDGTNCVKIDCERHPMDVLERCRACSKESNPLVWLVNRSNCIVCPDDCSSCGTMGCTNCINNTFWNAITWNCESCQNNNLETEIKCNTCIGRVYVNLECKYCPQNCIKCMTEYSCDECSGTKIWWDNACVDSFYKDKENCESCSLIHSYYFESGLCQTCFSHMNLDNAYQCVQCGLYINNNVMGKFWDLDVEECLNCPTMCLVCSNAEFCDVCPDAMYYEYETNSCERCLINCANCKTSNTCLNCEEGFYLNNESPSCNVCPKSCKMCISSNFCLVCNDNTYWKSEIGFCKSCIPNCNICSTAEPCTKCDPKYYLHIDDSHNCLSCSVNCYECLSDKYCLTCDENFCLNKNKECIADTHNCLTCNQDYGLSTYSCETCIKNYKLKLCLECSQNCLICSDDEKCTKCMDGYYIYSFFCHICQENCLECSSETNCSKCKIGYYFDSKEIECLKCPENCATCKSRDTCSACVFENYFFDADLNMCLTCKNNCKSCTSQNKCVQCYDDSVFDTTISPSSCTKCSVAIEGCRKCRMLNENLYCDNCYEYYMLGKNDKSCIKCPKNCKICMQQNDICIKCNTNHYISNDQANCYTKRCFECLSGNNSCANITSTSIGNKYGCKHLGVASSCWITTKSKFNETINISYSRTCKSIKCPKDSNNMMCTNSFSTNETVCERCCSEDSCNYGLISSAITHQSNIVFYISMPLLLAKIIYLLYL